MYLARRVPRALLLGAASLVLLSCGGDRVSSPPGIVEVKAPVAAFTAGDPALATQINAQIEVLFYDLPRIEQARKHFAQVVSQWNKEHPEQARDLVSKLITNTLTQLDQGLIRDGDGSSPYDPLPEVVAFFNDLYVYVGLAIDDQQVDADTYLAVVMPSPDEQTFNSGLEQWTVIPGGTFSHPVLLYVDRQGELEDIGSGFPPASDPYEVHFIPDVAFQKVFVAICADENLPFGATRLAHRIDEDKVEILDPIPNDFICADPEIEIGDATPSLRPRGFLAYAKPFAKRVMRVFTPTTLYAGHAATMGGVTTLSPLQVVIVGTSLTTRAPTVTEGQDASIYAQLTDAAGSPLAAHTLYLFVDNEARGTAVTDEAGNVVFTVSGLAVGEHTYQVTFGGAFGLESSSSSGTLTVLPYEGPILR